MTLGQQWSKWGRGKKVEGEGHAPQDNDVSSGYEEVGERAARRAGKSFRGNFVLDDGNEEWVHDRPPNFPRTAKAPTSFQVPRDDKADAPPEELAPGEHEVGATGRRPRQVWEREGGRSLAQPTDKRLAPPPDLAPFDLSIKGTVKARVEGAKALAAPADCVPTGAILSKEEELVKMWRVANRVLIPHFARQQQAKGLNMTELGFLSEPANRSNTDAPGARARARSRVNEGLGEGHAPMLTSFPDAATFSSLISAPDGEVEKKKNKEDMMIGPQSSRDPDVIPAAAGVKMLRYMALRETKGRLTDAASGPDTLAPASSLGTDVFGWRARPWLGNTNQTLGEYGDEDAGPVETPSGRAERRRHTVVAILGTGRMAKRLALLWTLGGYRVLLGSREAARGRTAAREVQRDAGDTVEVVAGGEGAWAVKRASIVVLAVPFAAAGPLLAALRPHLAQGKIILDITNPKYDSQMIENIAAVDINRAVLNSPECQWAVAYKSVFSRALQFGPDNAQMIDICGDQDARVAVADLVRSHGWNPRVRGTLREAIALEPGRRVAQITQMYGSS